MTLDRLLSAANSLIHIFDTHFTDFFARRQKANLGNQKNHIHIYRKIGKSLLSSAYKTYERHLLLLEPRSGYHCAEICMPENPWPKTKYSD